MTRFAPRARGYDTAPMARRTSRTASIAAAGRRAGFRCSGASERTRRDGRRPAARPPPARSRRLRPAAARGLAASADRGRRPPAPRGLGRRELLRLARGARRRERAARPGSRRARRQSGLLISDPDHAAPGHRHSGPERPRGRAALRLDHARPHRPGPRPDLVPVDPARPARRRARPRLREDQRRVQFGGPHLAVQTVRASPGSRSTTWSSSTSATSSS